MSAGHGDRWEVRRDSMRQYTVIRYRYVALMGVGWLPREQVHHYTAVPLVWRAKRFINAHAPSRSQVAVS